MNFNPDNWLDLVAYAIVGIPATIAAIAAVRGSKKATEHNEEQRDINTRTLDQVQNNHTTNLRDDIDHFHSSILANLTEIRRDIGGLREELRTERLERIAGDRIRNLGA